MTFCSIMKRKYIIILIYMDTLLVDVLECIIKAISDNKDKCNLMMTCKGISKCNFYFTELTTVDKISSSNWFDRFINIFIKDDICTLPLFVKYLTYDVWFNKDIKDKIPNSVTHLAFGEDFEYLTSNYYCSSLTYMEYIGNKIAYFKDCIPSSVTHLTIGAFFYSGFNDSIPSTVTHLTLNSSVYMPIDIPLSITHLTFGNEFNLSIKGRIPPSVIEIVFDGEMDTRSGAIYPFSSYSNIFKHPIEDCIPQTVKKIIFNGAISEKHKSLVLESLRYGDSQIFFYGEIY